MKRLCGWMTGVAGCLLTAGCIDSAVVVNLNPDGTGTVVETVYVSPAAEQMMQGMTAGMGAAPGAAPAPKSKVDVEQCKARVATMGEGVTFVGAKEVTKPDGSSGYEATYAFKDVNTLKLGTEPRMPMPQGRDPSAKPGSSVSFEMAKGGASKLVIHMPKPKTEGQTPNSVPPAAQPPREPSEQELAMMKQMFNGFRMRMQVKVKGAISDSNATYVESEAGKKQIVTLMDMNIGQLMQDDAAFKKLAAMGQIKDMETARTKLKDFPGLKMETAERVEVSFK